MTLLLFLGQGVEESAYVVPTVVSTRTLYTGTKPALALRDTTGGAVAFMVDMAGNILLAQDGTPLIAQDGQAGTLKLKTGTKPSLTVRRVS